MLRPQIEYVMYLIASRIPPGLGLWCQRCLDEPLFVALPRGLLGPSGILPGVSWGRPWGIPGALLSGSWASWGPWKNLPGPSPDLPGPSWDVLGPSRAAWGLWGATRFASGGLWGLT